MDDCAIGRLQKHSDIERHHNRMCCFAGELHRREKEDISVESGKVAGAEERNTYLLVGRI